MTAGAAVPVGAADREVRAALAARDAVQEEAEARAEVVQAAASVASGEARAEVASVASVAVASAVAEVVRAAADLAAAVEVADSGAEHLICIICTIFMNIVHIILFVGLGSCAFRNKRKKPIVAFEG